MYPSLPFSQTHHIIQISCDGSAYISFPPLLSFSMISSQIYKRFLLLVSKCMTLYFTVLNSLPSVILRSSRSFNFCSNFFLIQLKYWFLIKPAAQQAVLKFDYTLVEVLFPCSHFPSCLCPYAQYNSSYWEGKQNIHLVWDCILIIFKLYLVITAWHSDSLFLDLFSHADTGLGNTLSVLTSFYCFVFFKDTA